MIAKKTALLGAKGFAMGMADIVPGVSGGTIALITGIYDELIATISSVNKSFFQKLLNWDLKAIKEHLNLSFILPLFLGIISAIFLMSRLMHFLMGTYPVYTWSLFFGLILASVLIVGKMIPNLLSPRHMCLLLLGSVVGGVAVSLIPVQTPDTPALFFLSGCIAICAMILPGISGSFILLILGKYLPVTAALKNPFLEDNLLIIIVFSLGCLTGLLSFSKVLNFLLSRYHSLTMSVLTGFMLGSLKKIWPWKRVLESQIIRGKEYVLAEKNILPSAMDQELVFAISFMLIGFVGIILLEKIAKPSAL